jgi:hypothetical protein
MNKVFSSKKFVVMSLAISGVVMGLSFASSSFANSSVFRPTGTSPKINGVATMSPYLKIIFSKALSSKGVVVNSSLSVVSGYSVSGKILTLKLTGHDVHEKIQYTIVIKSISSLGGDHISNL